MTDRKLLEDVRDALKPFADYSIALDKQNADNLPSDAETWHGSLKQMHIRRTATTLARVEAALAETEEEKVERVAPARSERRRILEALGGKCVVCGVSNPSWLHVDYIPTTKGQPYRHSRTLKFTLENLPLFRILCANHHYELTLTGKIEGTDIVQ